MTETGNFGRDAELIKESEENNWRNGDGRKAVIESRGEEYG
jgi:hypothetical protein